MATSDGATRGMQGLPRAVKWRAWIATALVTLLLAGVGYRAWGLQVEDAETFRERALRQHVHTVEIPAPRGAILDARGRPLAVTADAESIYVNPGAVVDVVTTADRLASLLDLDPAAMEARLSSRRHFAWIARHVTPAQAAAIRAAKLPGVEITTEPRRWYPGRTSGGPLLGFAGIDGDGLDGLELRFDKLLRGQRARFDALRDARGKTALADGVVDAVPGATVHLTIDRAIQDLTDAALGEAVTSHGAKAGVAVVLDVHTGAVLAMSSWPTYDPNEPADAVAAGARNRAVTDVFEIGSVMKIFTVSAALDAGVTRPDEMWDVENGSYRIGNHTFRDTHHDPELTTAGIIKRSSNVGAIKIAQRLGRDRFYAALTRFGFGHRTGIELPHEETGTVRDGSRWRDIELATIAFGHGLTVTPLQVASALAALGDGGTWHTPHLVDRVVGADGATVWQPTLESRRIYEPKTAAQMLPILAGVFEHGKHGGTAGNVVVEGFRAGGKTGTAHKLDPVTKRYAEHTYLASFAGLAPIDDPRIAVVVVIDEPQGKDYFGGKVSAPVFATVVSQTLRYLGVPGDPSAPTAEDLDPALAAAKARADARAEARAKADAKARAKADDDDDVAEVVDLPPVSEAVDDVDIPDFRGASIARALDLARTSGLVIDVDGSGRAVAQEPAPGRAPAGTVVRVTFAAGTAPPPPVSPEKPR
ncbi:MAG: transpeptidase family protein [Kofleriaceae bacterium]|nr:transpeptidase family protein [Kofleriaceae bacterium]MCB9574043.1 transpeptidase family protein [Kofleriaceae bacterium]